MPMERFTWLMVTEGVVWLYATTTAYAWAWLAVFFPRVADAEHAELMACHQALVFAKEQQVAKVILETAAPE